MLHALVLAALMTLSLPVGLAFAAPVQHETIEPNCTLDPFTGKEVCHIWPTCTMDPWTGKLHCPAPPPKKRV